MDVVKYFNDSFIDTTKISVELAKTFSDNSLVSSKDKKRKAREAEEYRELKRKKMEEEMRNKKRNKKQELSFLDDENDDPTLKEFMTVYGNQKKSSQTWKNDDITMDINKVAELNEQQQKEIVQAAERESDDEYEDLTKPPASKPTSTQNDDEEEFEEPVMSLDQWANKNEEEKPATENAEDAPQNDPEMSDLDWLKRHQQRIPENEKPASESAKEKKEYKAQPEEPKEPELTEEEQNIANIRKSKRLFLRNLLYTATEEDFRNLFSPYGQLEEVHIATDTRTGNSKGFAYIQFVDAEDAIKAYQELDKQIFQGRLLHILPAKPKREHTLDEYDLKNLPLKKQNEIKRKLAAAKQQFAWNTLYLNSDAVMSSVAKRLGVKKSDLLSPDSSDAAVTQALAEASVINNVRKYFESKGIDLLAFNKKERSDKIILVKNFPFETSVEEIAKLFSEFGDLKKVLMPPDGGIAMVVFKNPGQAKTAFSRLAYKRFKNTILYLEKGPAGLFEDDDNEEDETVESVKADKPVKEIKPSAAELLDIAKDVKEKEDEEEEDEIVPSTSVFVKNLNFETTTKQLTDAFKNLDGFLVAQVKMKPNPKKQGSYLSMGFGFVEFKTKDQAKVAIKAMDGTVLDGHKLQLKISTRGQDGADSKAASTTKSKGKKSSKLLIKNLPFEATKDGVYKIFSAPGGLRSVRIPRKFDKTPRGFAFAEYTTVKDAENALNTLQGTHYYGRHLVLQYAKADAENAEEEIERNTEKMRKQITNVEIAELRATGKRTIDLGDGNDEDFE